MNLKDSMRHFCTYFDKNYICQALCLYESLEVESKGEFALWMLCLDDTAYDIISKLKLQYAYPVNHQDFCNLIPRQKIAQSNRSRIEYYYTCTPAFIQYVFKMAKEATSVTYLDADLFFFSDPELIYNENVSAHVLIVEHRGRQRTEETSQAHGKYNVCLVHFDGSMEAKECLTWWADSTFRSTSFSDGVFGDQKYLDEFPLRFAGVHTIMNLGVCPAAWNIGDYSVRGTSTGVFVQDCQLIVYHFARFSVVIPDVFVPVRRIYLSRNVLDTIYKPYMISIMKAYQSVRNLVPKFGFSQNLRNALGTGVALILGRGFFLKNHQLRRIGISIPFGYEILPQNANRKID